MHEASFSHIATRPRDTSVPSLKNPQMSAFNDQTAPEFEVILQTNMKILALMFLEANASFMAATIILTRPNSSSGCPRVRGSYEKVDQKLVFNQAGYPMLHRCGECFKQNGEEAKCDFGCCDANGYCRVTGDCKKKSALG